MWTVPAQMPLCYITSIAVPIGLYIYYTINVRKGHSCNKRNSYPDSEGERKTCLFSMENHVSLSRLKGL